MLNQSLKSTSDSLSGVLLKIENAQNQFRDRMKYLTDNGGMKEEMYVRLLSMEYHLTKDVQRHFILAASHPDLSKRKGFRQFLLDFANEEELHYLIAKKDLEHLGHEPVPCPLDVKLWKAYFDSVILDRPFLRLGGTCILENITGGSRDLLANLISSAKYLDKKNTHFIVLHQHGDAAPHGDQIVTALRNAKLDDKHIADVEEGCSISTTQFIRMIDWCISG